MRPLFTGQTSQSNRRCEEGRHRAIHGGTLSNRISANAVGRRSSFLRARDFITSVTPLRACRKGDAGAPEGCARRSGLKFAEAVPGPILQPRPSGAQAPPLGAFPGGATWLKLGRKSPLQKMTSAAYTVSRDSVAEVTAECCQARFFLKWDVNRKGYRGKIRSMARTV